MTNQQIPTHALPALLRAARLFAGLTQAQLADEFGVSQSAVRNWEAAKSTPKGQDVQNWILAQIHLLTSRMEPLIDKEDEFPGQMTELRVLSEDSEALTAFALASLGLALGAVPEFVRRQ